MFLTTFSKNFYMMDLLNSTGIASIINFSNFDINLLYAGIVMAATVIMTVIMLIGRNDPTKSDKRLRESPFLKDRLKDVSDNNKEIKLLKEKVAHLEMENQKLSIQDTSQSATIEELRKDYKDLVKKIDGLLEYLLAANRK